MSAGRPSSDGSSSTGTGAGVWRSSYDAVLLLFGNLGLVRSLRLITGLDHLAVGTKGVHAHGQQIVMLGDPVVTDGSLAIGTDVVIVLTDQDQTGAVLNFAVNVVVIATVFIYDAILLFFVEYRPFFSS